MLKRRLIWLLIAGVALAGTLVVVWNRTREPEYGGKKLSEWVERTYWSSSQWAPGAGDFSGLPVVRPNEAVDAIRQIGTNGVPYLSEWIGYDAPRWKIKSFALIKKITHSTLTDHRTVRADGALRALIVMGAKAEGAVPTLALLLNDPTSTNRARRAARVLSELMQDLIPASVALMTNNNAANYRVGSIETLRINGVRGNRIAPALPGLLRCLHDTNGQVRWAAAMMLGQAGFEPGVVVPALVQSLQDKRPNVREAAIYGLGAFHTQARPALPALVPLLTDPDPDIRGFATNALRKIDPEAVERGAQ